jgi:hypothetical protein
MHPLCSVIVKQHRKTEIHANLFFIDCVLPTLIVAQLLEQSCPVLYE